MLSGQQKEFADIEPMNVEQVADIIVQMADLIERIYWKCKRHSNCASGPAAHHLADEIVKMIERET